MILKITGILVHIYAFFELLVTSFKSNVKDGHISVLILTILGLLFFSAYNIMFTCSMVGFSLSAGIVFLSFQIKHLFCKVPID